MPTKLISKALLGTLSAAILSAPAFAGGNCGGGNCAMPVQVLPSYAPQFGPMTIQNQNPMGHLRSINFQRAPHVSITRVHGLPATAALSDAPSGFTGGCHPSSTTYCRQDAGRPVQVELNQNAYAAPAPVMSAPVMSSAPTVQYGGGYDESKFTPRVYGDASLVPGIAYLPTSQVVRDPAAAQQVLDSGRTVAQPVVVPGTGTAPHMGMVQQGSAFQSTGGYNTSVQSMSYQGGSYQGSYSSPVIGSAPGLTQSQGLSLVPTRQGPSFGQPSAPVLQQSGPMAGTFSSPIGADGTYWEKVSGPTAFGDTIATTVICKRKAQTNVIRPTVGVPVPVPVPVAAPVCRTMGPHGPHAGHTGSYVNGAPGRWTY